MQTLKFIVSSFIQHYIFYHYLGTFLVKIELWSTVPIKSYLYLEL